MTSSIRDNTHTVFFPPSEMTELVRGCEQELIDHLAPLVRQQDVELDLGAVERIDAAGISALISLYCKAHSAGHGFSIVNPSLRVIEVLNLVGLDRVLYGHDGSIQPAGLDEECVRSAA